ncbi:MAG: hypothetical protein ABIR96_06215 [Bdellovibrionota bacterium]
MIFSSLVVAASTLLPCANFSGVYGFDDSSGGSLEIHQENCEELDANYDFGNGSVFTRHMIFDGEMRTLVVIEGLTELEATKLEDDTIVVETEDHFGNGDVHVSSGKIFLEPAGDLVEETVYVDDSGHKTGVTRSV